MTLTPISCYFLNFACGLRKADINCNYQTFDYQTFEKISIISEISPHLSLHADRLISAPPPSKGCPLAVSAPHPSKGSKGRGPWQGGRGVNKSRVITLLTPLKLENVP